MKEPRNEEIVTKKNDRNKEDNRGNEGKKIGMWNEKLTNDIGKR